MNQAFFQRLEIDDDGTVASASLAFPFAQMHAYKRLRQYRREASIPRRDSAERARNAEPALVGAGSSDELMVEVPGIEPRVLVSQLRKRYERRS